MYQNWIIKILIAQKHNTFEKLTDVGHRWNNFQMKFFVWEEYQTIESLVFRKYFPLEKEKAKKL